MNDSQFLHHFIRSVIWFLCNCVTVSVIIIKPSTVSIYSFIILIRFNLFNGLLIILLKKNIQISPLLDGIFLTHESSDYTAKILKITYRDVKKEKNTFLISYIYTNFRLHMKVIYY